MRLAMKRWLFWGLMQRWGATEEVMDMEEVMWGHVMTDPLEEEEEEEEEDEEVGSRVVARCSFSGSTSMESKRTWAVLRGCRSFCTAAVRKRRCLTTQSFTFESLTVNVCISTHLPSLFMPACRHFFSRHAWHWLRWALSTGHMPVPAWHLLTHSQDFKGRVPSKLTEICNNYKNTTLWWKGSEIDNLYCMSHLLSTRTSSLFIFILYIFYFVVMWQKTYIRVLALQ